MEMAAPLARYKVGWKHFKCRYTWDQQTHRDFPGPCYTLTATTTTTKVLNNEEQVDFPLNKLFWGALRKY